MSGICCSASKPSSRLIVAVLGGDGRIPGKIWKMLPPGAELRQFQGARYGGDGEIRALEQALKRGTIRRVLILARWNGHSATDRILKLCRKLGIVFVLIP